MAINTAIIITINEPDLVFEIFIYQSGKNRYTTKIKSMIGNPKTIAIGRPP